MKKYLLSFVAVFAAIQLFASGVVATAAKTDPTCNGSCNGTASAAASGGVGPYSFSWTGPSGYTAVGANISGLCAGTYIVTALDSSDLSTAQYTVSLTAPPAVTVAGTSVSYCIGQTGMMSCSPSGGTGSYTYSWAPATGLTSTTGPNPGVNITTSMGYTVTVTDANGCSGTATVVAVPIPIPAPVAGSNSPVCEGAALNLSVGNVAGGTYSWVGPSGYISPIQNPVITNAGSMNAGIYTVAVTYGGCTATATTNVTVTQSPQITLSPIPASCGLCNGSINNSTIAASTYNWVGPSGFTSTVMNPTNLCAGTYTVTAMNTFGCMAASSATVTNASSPVASISSVTPASCGSCNGGATIGVTGGTAPYAYQWNGINTPAVVTGVCAGTYTVNVIDANGCSSTVVATIPSTPAITAIDITAMPAGCGSSTGSVTLGTVTGGTPAYEYSFGAGVFSSVTSYTGLAAGAYAVVVMDANGCTFSTTAVVANTGGPTAVAVTTVSSGCTVNTGELTIGAVTGGTLPYTYSVDGGLFSTTLNYTGLAAGTHAVMVKDASGCVYTEPVTIGTINPPVIALDNLQNISCSGGITGSISILMSGGTPGYTYAWSNGTTTQNISGLTAAGGYSIVVTDQVGCTASQTYYISSLSALYGSVSTVNGNCGTLGSATANAMGGSGVYTYSWSTTPAQTTATATGLATGFYNCVVTDSAGCSVTLYAGIYNGCYNTIKGKVFDDVNSNCIQDAGEAGFAYKTVYATGASGTFYATTDANGDYTLLTQNANNVVTYSAYTIPYYSAVCPASGSLNVNFTTLGDTLFNNDFALYANPVYFDLGIHPGWTTGNPGFTKQYWIYYNNYSPTAQNATVTFIYDSALVFSNCSAGGVHYPAQHKVEWTYTALPPMYYVPGMMRPTVNFMVPATLSTSTMLHSYFEISPVTGDAYPSNNIVISDESVLGCHDPNSKSVTPAGTGPGGDILQSDSILTYTVHFQNNGNDTAHFVEVRDTLSYFLDPATVVPGAGSHDYTFSLSGEGVLTFRFDNIMLPDSTADLEGSNGYFTYTVKVKTGTPVGSVINNTASIYFDYNEAVVTNTTVNTIVLPVTTGIETKASNSEVNVYPNPFSDNATFVIGGDAVKDSYSFELMNILGKKVKMINNISDRQFEISRNGLPAGIYFYKIYHAAGVIGTGKLIIK